MGYDDDQEYIVDATREIDRLSTENASLIREIDEALAIGNHPDSTNDGGRANLVEVIQEMTDLIKVLVDDQVETNEKLERATR